MTSVEALVGRDDRRFWAFVECAGDGSFELAGLSARAYRLKAVDPESLLLVESEPIQAGTRGVRLEFPEDAVHARVRGRALASDGAGIPDVVVKVQRMALEFFFPDGGTRDQFTVGAEAVTDAEGRFELARVPRAGIHLQVELAPPTERADSLRVLDADGRSLALRIMRGSTSETNPRARLEDGRSHVLSLSERARWVVLYRDELEVARLPFAPTPAGVNVLRW